MDNSDYDVRVDASIFDRLLDDDPKNSREVLLSRAESVRAMRRAVQRDLEILLNTRNPLFDLAPEFENASSSVIAFGLPDFTALNVGNPSHQERLRQQIKHVLEVFEPRLRSVTLTLVPEGLSERVLRLRVDAQLVIDPVSEDVSFDIVMPLINRSYEVKEQ